MWNHITFFVWSMKFVALPETIVDIQVVSCKSKKYSTYELSHFSVWWTMKLFSYGFLWKNLTFKLSQMPFCSTIKKLTKKAPLLLVNIMKPINLPRSFSTGRVTIVLLLLCNLWEKNFQKCPGFWHPYQKQRKNKKQLAKFNKEENQYRIKHGKIILRKATSFIRPYR